MICITEFVIFNTSLSIIRLSIDTAASSGSGSPFGISFVNLAPINVSAGATIRLHALGMDLFLNAGVNSTYSANTLSPIEPFVSLGL